MDKEINKITNHLQVILEISKEIESIYTLVVLCQTIVSLIVLCTCLYMISLVEAFSLESAKELAYMSAVGCQTFLYCYFGNKVRISSEMLPLAIYSMDWLSTTTSFKRTMIINMIRMQKGIYFTIGKFTPLTLSTFVQILRGSYSVFAVLKNSSS
nr:odorant receptor 2a-like [Onthophagus taurus]